MPYKVNVNDPLPKFKVKDHNGFEVTNEDIVGVPLLLYFYPKDNTPGCTLEACGFQEKLEEFDKLDVLVLGVSPDSLASHQKFIQDHKLEFSLLSDPDLKMCKSFDVIRDGTLERTSFLVDAVGIIRWIERPVKVEGHTARVIDAVKKVIPKEHITEMMKDVDKDYGKFMKDSVKPKKP